MQHKGPLGTEYSAKICPGNPGLLTKRANRVYRPIPTVTDCENTRGARK